MTITPNVHRTWSFWILLALMGTILAVVLFVPEQHTEGYISLIGMVVTLIARIIKQDHPQASAVAAPVPNPTQAAN